MQDAITEPTIEVEAVVIRCGCGDPDSHNGTRGPARPCPQPKE